MFPPDPRAEAAAALVEAGVRVESSAPRETRKVKRLVTPDGPVHREVVYRDWEASGRAGDHDVEIVLNDSGRIIFGKCTCEHFADHLLNQGPCAHMMALHAASETARRDLPTSEAAQPEPEEDDD